MRQTIANKRGKYSDDNDDTFFFSIYYNNRYKQ